MAAQPTDGLPSEIIVEGRRITTPVANPLATGWDKVLDTLLGLGSAYAAVEIDGRRISQVYKASGAGFYKTPSGSYAPIPTDSYGNPLPGYVNAGSVGGFGINQNLLILGLIIGVGFLIYRKV